MCVPVYPAPISRNNKDNNNEGNEGNDRRFSVEIFVGSMYVVDIYNVIVMMTDGSDEEDDTAQANQLINYKSVCVCQFDADDCGSHWSSLTMEGSLLAPSMNSWRDSFPSAFLSICLKIFSVLFSGVDSSSGIFITDPTIL